ncbi:MAG: amino acid adenylation domain-containing protein [Pyrinomonadaceae bacterium]
MQSTVEGYELSPQQKRVWSLDDGGAAYRSQCAVTVEGPLRAEELAEAAAKVVARHESLRTTLARRPDLTFPLQTVSGGSAPPLCQLDLRNCAPEALRARIEELLREEREREFDLAVGPLFRLCLAELATDRHLLVLTLHSLCADAQSIRNVAAELLRFLSPADGESPEETDALLQYADFAQWQNELLEGEAAENGSAFWASQNPAGAAELRLPFERRAAAGGRFSPARQTLFVDQGLLVAMRQACRSLDVTFADFMRAAWQTLLWRHAGQNEVVVGDLCTGYKELESAVGLFAKLLPVGCRVSPDARFSEVLRRSAEARRSAGEWQEYFAWGPQPDARAPRESFFAAAFEHILSHAQFGTARLKVVGYEDYVCFDRFKLKLCCAELGGVVHAELQYDASAFDWASVALLADQLLTLLAHAARAPETPVGELEVLGAVERRRLLVELNDTARRHADGRCVHELFEEQAALLPDATAVVCEDRRLSYAELNARANRLARHLRALGAGPDAAVGLYLERSVDLIVGMLGILKAGAGYVPLEPAQPAERLGHMIEDVRPLAVVTERRLAAALPAGAGHVVCLDDADGASLAESAEDLRGGALPGSLVYIIFTSGSTGRPKGVVVEHRQLSNYVSAVQERLRLVPGESFATVSTFAADLGHTSIFPALTSGGCLHIVTQERASDPDALAEYFGRERVDVLKIVPSHLEALLTSAAPERVLPRRRLVLGGEASRWELYERVRGLAPALEVFNHYGPTETTVGTLTFRVAAGGDGAISAGIPLGHPIHNSQARLLDGRMRPVATGLLGELYVGGAGVTRGYLNRPALTAERFVPDPFSEEPGARLYRTGDLARYLPGGEVEFVGRADTQVKFHGYRVELDEIRHSLNRHPQVRDSVVVIARDSNGLDALVAYYVARQELEAGALREFLAASILKETLPGIFVHLKKLPLSLNGKINYRALPSLEEIRRQDRRTFVAPRTPAEQQVAAVWAEVLGIERVGVHDNFFEIGGHSLLATRVTTRLREAFRVELPLRTVFEEPTVEGLAVAITQLQLEQAGDEELQRLLEEVTNLSDDATGVAHAAE